jgi:hypothetical protein
MATKIIMTDGTRSETLYRVKTIDPFTDETPGVWTPDSKNDAAKRAQSARLVPSVFAGIGARMQAMMDLPFKIYNVKGDKPLDDSDNYKNVVGFLPYPSRHFALTEGALTVAGQAYWFKGTGERSGNVKQMKYWLPTSVQLDSDAAKKGEIKFKRTGVSDPFKAEQVLYTWLLDPMVELGPPTMYPLESALTAALANGAITNWVKDYMLRGAVKAMLLMVDGTPPRAEVEKMESWFNRFMSGARGLMWKVFNATNVKPTIVGDGLEALKDLSINKELRYEIHQALGTRHLLEDENFATASARERQFYTITIMPDARLIQGNLNEQVLHDAGYHLEFEPERLEVFQENESEQARALSDLFGTLKEALSPDVALKLAMDMLQIKLTEDQKALIAEGMGKKEQEKAELARQMEKQNQQNDPADDEPQTTQNQQPPNKAIIELDRWEAKVTKAKKMVTWHAVNIPLDIAKAVSDGTLSFADARKKLEGQNDNAALVLEGMRISLDALALARGQKA